ncbi:LysR family transcriptional regulator [Affinibrenneria salicis]|uniref:LysR family transcriptional regulator n=1 Tax=Affinibrenneria salicis TaxID=2590031 RepID=A0A5J5FZ94_9GAMM|nr:LysR family transcriptional regulator [Affinibrenneria salicis]KAA8999355.1 LysR family transcriptional regulator [Affinibrenneria salicis]
MKKDKMLGLEINKRLDAMHIASLEIFCATAKSENFSTAAEDLGITPAAVSRSIKRLEERLGFRLFLRNTRRTGLTQDGRDYYEKCSEIIELLKESELAIKSKINAPVGRIKISVPEMFANYKIIPYLPEFCDKYPLIKIDLHVTSRNVDFISEMFDISIRLIRSNTQLDGFLVEKTLCVVSSGLYASPAYLAKNGAVNTLDDLKKHKCINFSTSEENRSFPWLIMNGDIPAWIKTESQVRIFDNISSARDFALNDGGIVQLFDFSVQDALNNGSLVEVLQNFKVEDAWKFSFLYSGSKRKSVKVKAFTDFFYQKLQAEA